jgi:diadenosine tetraphosphate (Ap4A) HIT family hydrolase
MRPGLEGVRDGADHGVLADQVVETGGAGICAPARDSVTEITDLGPNEQVQLLGEIDAAARALKSVTEYEKLNIAALGNQVAQLHVHVIGRRHSDKAWPKPVWGVAPPAAYVPAVRDGLIGSLRRGLKISASG